MTSLSTAVFLSLFTSCSGKFHCNVVVLQLQILFAEESLNLVDILITANKLSSINLFGESLGCHLHSHSLCRPMALIDTYLFCSQ